MRAKLGFATEDTVFTFVSAGHYRRKGFFLAVDAIANVRAKVAQHVLSAPDADARCANARLLVVGGRQDRLATLQKQLNLQHPDWREFVTFTGMVPDVERHFAASDAFLFPSYSEAFALVEVEAAACGLPLFLTRHHGSEMILEEGVNGHFLEFDSHQIAAVLAEFVRGHWKPHPGIHLKHALDIEAYAQRLADVLSSACAAISDGDPLMRPSPAPLVIRPS
jgi:glycosyltransferase involved in cell wall biosynthesis